MRLHVNSDRGVSNIDAWVLSQHKDGLYIYAYKNRKQILVLYQDDIKSAGSGDIQWAQLILMVLVQ